MWFGILGPMLVRDEAGVVEVAGARQRVLLGAMLLRTGTAVPADTLAELDTLARAHLIQPAGPGRYSLHDLLRGYARELAAADGEAEHVARRPLPAAGAAGGRPPRSAWSGARRRRRGSW